MKHLWIIVSFLSATWVANALPIQEIRTASATELVAFFHDPTFNGPVWGRTYTTNAVNISITVLVDTQRHARKLDL